MCSNKHSTQKAINWTLGVCMAQHWAKCRGEMRMSMIRLKTYRNDNSLLLGTQYGSGVVVSALLVLTHFNIAKPSEKGAIIPILCRLK